MGAAAAQLATKLGGEVTVLDIVDVDYPTARALHVDLSDKASVDAALGELDGTFQSVFSCAGIAGGEPLMRINFISQRHIIDTMRGDGRLGRGTAVCMISSIGGASWQSQIPQALDFLARDTWEGMEAWLDEHEGNNHYGFSKVAMNTYIAHSAFGFARDGMR